MNLEKQMVMKMSRCSSALKCGLIALGLLCSLAGCATTVEWTEDVLLLDGRVITVTQKKSCAGGNFRSKTNASCLARDAWVKLKIPEITSGEIIWHEKLDVMVINIYNKRLYIVGMPPTSLEFRRYGAINPPYIGFVWELGSWRRILFSDIPKEIYEGNMLVSTIPKQRSSHITLDDKKVDRADGSHAPDSIDPTYKILAN